LVLDLLDLLGCEEANSQDSPLSSRQTKTFIPKAGYFPETGDDTIAGGIFCISLAELGPYLQRVGNNPGAGGTEAPRQASAPTVGTGPYPAQMLQDPSLPNHTIFAPKVPPNITMPILAWGNGGCGLDPSGHQNFLLEIASHGYVIAADGKPGGVAGRSQSLVTDMRASVDWASKGGASKYGPVDNSTIVTMGHSCGGLESMSTAYHDDRVKRIMLFNIAIFQDDRRYLLQEIKVPVAYFIGGPSDMGYPNVRSYPPFLSPQNVLNKFISNRFI
jgi:hypothetical protein